MIYKFIVSMSVIAASHLHADTTPYDFSQVADKHIISGYQKLSDQTTLLKKTASDYCHAQATLPLLQKVFSDTFTDWQTIQHIRFGPIQYLSREHRYELWPDKRGTVGKHLSRLKQNTEVESPNFDISSKSVAVQGFPALERLIFSDQPTDATSCILIQAISTNLSNMTNSLTKEWTQGDLAYRSAFIAPSADNAFFESDKELAGQLLNSLHTQLEFMITQKLDRPLGSSLSNARGKRSESWRSGSAITALKANSSATKQLYELAFKPKLSTHLAKKIDSAFIEAEKSLLQISTPLKQAVSDPTSRKKVLQLREHLSALKQLIGKDLATELDLSLGFNSLDGD